MVQFKDVFTGVEQRAYTRATTAQKCVRAGGKHNDLDEVGPSPRHHVFFEMMGNFSFGDYFKRDAVAYAWEFCTRELGMDPERLWPTVHHTDDEAFALWRQVTPVPAERITRLGDEDNLWQMADVGPCGYNSEIFYDRGERYGCGGAECRPGCECERFWEFWNLVFMQFYQDESGVRTPLPRTNVDTGLGLERTVAILQGAESNYDTDLFLPIMDRVQALAGQTDEDRAREYIAYRVIADHSRASAFLIADGVLPGNEGRSYVARRIIRRAIRYGRKLGLDGPFLTETTRVVVEQMGDHYSELRERWDTISDALRREEEHFARTLSQGVGRLDALIDGLVASGQEVIPGDEAFRLYDTYGFPLDLTVELAADRNLRVDREGFEQALRRQQERSRGASAFAARLPAAYFTLPGDPTHFTGYTALDDSGTVLALLREGERQERLEAGQEGELLVTRTPFYAESGGQVGDTGIITGPEGDFEVTDTQRPVPGYTLHRGRALHGRLRVGEQVELAVDRDRRGDIVRNHTATHILHRALRDTLGPQAQQAGSLVAPDRLRFDFTQSAALSDEERWELESVINARTQDDRRVWDEQRPYAEAVAGGAMALFGEKYGDVVRVVSIEGYGSELCGGTHVHHTGEIGPIYLTSEGSISSGVRRIEAVSGRGATRHVRERLQTLERAGAALRVPPLEVERQIATLQERLREQERQLSELRRQAAGGEVDALAKQVRPVDGAQLLVGRSQAESRDAMRELADRLRDRLGSGIIVLGGAPGGRPSVLAVVTPDVVERGAHAGRLVQAITAIMGGRGNGKPHRAEGGATDAGRLDEALAGVEELVAKQLSRD
jgi:alanyl-tRNA synthetase